MWHAWERGGELYKVLVGKPKETNKLGRPRHKWEDGLEWIVGRLAEWGCGVDSVGSG
jgi:hypothetical protein